VGDAEAPRERYGPLVGLLASWLSVGVAALAPWPAPAHPADRAAAAGVPLDRVEYLDFHVHAHLDVFLNARRVRVPALIGIDEAAIEDVGEQGRCLQPCISALHTHDTDGIIHIESGERRTFRLGQFFTVWGVRLDRRCVQRFCRPRTRIGTYVDGRRRTADPRTLHLADGQEIAIVIGRPPKTIPSRFPLE